MFTLLAHKGSGCTLRLEADAALTPADFQRIAHQLGVRPIRARKIGYIAAVRATKSQVVETRWNGKETNNTARPGDWIVTNLSPQQDVLRDCDGNTNRYVIAAERFGSLYEPAQGASPFGDTYRARAEVEALLLPGGFDIVAPWGERQTAPAGYLLFNGADVYGNNEETFLKTYNVLCS